MSIAQNRSTHRARRVLFRVDASSTIGVGHLVRCLALAEYLNRRGFSCVFEMAEAPGDRHEWVTSAGHELIVIGRDPKQHGPNRDAARFEWAVLDHYGLGASWLNGVKPYARNRLVIDDLADRALPCELLTNPDPAATRDAYRRLTLDTTQLLLGTRYVLLRSEFAAVRVARHFESVKQVLVAMGGGSSRGAAETAIAAVRLALPTAHVVLIKGDGDPAPKGNDQMLTVQTDLDALQMARSMATADIAIGAGGTSAWERCLMGLPSIIVRVAANQDHIADALSAAEAALDAGPTREATVSFLAELVDGLAANAGHRRRLSMNGRALVDGQGTWRIANVMDGVRVRRASSDDAKLLWAWANDPVVRTNSFTPDAIPWDEHVAWLSRRLSDADTLLLIGENGEGPVGQVRFDGRDPIEVSVSVAADWRDGLIGRLLLRSALNSMRNRLGAREVVAKVRVHNESSRRLFEAAGFAATRAAADRIEYTLAEGWST